MTEDITEVAQTDSGTDAPSNASVSQVATEHPSPDGGLSLEEVLQRLSQVEGQLRSFQSGKDKGIAKLNTKVNDLSEQIARYEEKRARGLKPEEALREMQIDDLLAQSHHPPVETGSDDRTVDNQAPSANQFHSSIIKGLGLDPNNAEVVQVLREAGKDVATLTAKLSEIALKKQQAPAAQPNEAQVLPTEQSGGDATTLENLQAELDGLKQDFSPAAMKRRRELSAQIKSQLPKR